ncbi:MAG: flavodoxin [Clostridiales bacterium]|jgi:flavodoxin|nr:flavodoxin [Clostridiales bacterium]
MAKVKVVYWSGTGNTEAMANAIGEGIVAGGAEADVKSVSNATVEELVSENVFALGCSSMGDEVLEETEMEPFVEELEKSVAGKKIALFGSYGWGDGQWMRDWQKRMADAGAEVVDGEGLICNEYPDDDALAKCKALGQNLAVM